MGASVLEETSLACKYCSAVADVKGKPWASQQGLSLHQTLCPENPDRTVRHRRKHAHGSRKGKRSSKALTVRAQREEQHRISFDPEAALENHISFAVSHCETYCDLYAKSLNIPGAAFAHRVGEILQRQASGPILRINDQVLRVRRNSSNGA